MKLIIQIPCYNEAETLRVALDHLPRQIDGVDEIEVLIINDGSTDRTVEVAREWGVKHIVSFKQNRLDFDVIKKFYYRIRKFRAARKKEDRRKPQLHNEDTQ